jgi:excisionase family DNA binding protein
VQELLADFRTQLLAEVQEVVTDAVRDALDARQHAPPLLTVEQVAERLNVSVRTVESLIADGELVPLRIRGARRFTDQTIDAFLRSCAGKKKRRRKRAT